MFHWLFALSFLGAYLTAEGEHWRALHVTLGYTLAGLLGFRVLYGLFGPRQAGLGAIWRKLRGAPDWLRTARQAIGRKTTAAVQWRQGQNLLMALAVVALLVLAAPLTLSGYATYNAWGDLLGGDWIGDVHAFIGNVFLAAVLGHVALIAGLSLHRRKNQALPMLTGRVAGGGPDLVPRNRGGMAALLLIATVAFGAWQWQQSPGGLIPTQAARAAASVESLDHGHE
jgi:cytochrome b